MEENTPRLVEATPPDSPKKAPESAAPKTEMFEEPAVRPTHYYVVSCSLGFVGAFYSAESAVAQITKYHESIAFLVQKFEVVPGPVARVWVVLYRNIDAVAFVSNNRDEAVRVQTLLGHLNLTYTDSIDYWTQRADTIPETIAAQLEVFSGAHKMYISGALTSEMLLAREQKALAQIERLTQFRLEQLQHDLDCYEKITIFDCVVPVRVGGTDEILRSDEDAVCTSADAVAAVAAADDTAAAVAADAENAAVAADSAANENLIEELIADKTLSVSTRADEASLAGMPSPTEATPPVEMPAPAGTPLQ